VIAGLESCDGITDFVDYTDAFMAKNATGPASRNVAFQDVQVRPAYRRL
jgi:hypothetical protein